MIHVRFLQSLLIDMEDDGKKGSQVKLQGASRSISHYGHVPPAVGANIVPSKNESKATFALQG